MSQPTTHEFDGRVWTLRSLPGEAGGVEIVESPHKADKWLPGLSDARRRLRERSEDGTLQWVPEAEQDGGREAALASARRPGIPCDECRQRVRKIRELDGRRLCLRCAGAAASEESDEEAAVEPDETNDDSIEEAEVEDAQMMTPVEEVLAAVPEAPEIVSGTSYPRKFKLQIVEAVERLHELGELIGDASNAVAEAAGVARKSIDKWRSDFGTTGPPEHTAADKHRAVVKALELMREGMTKTAACKEAAKECGAAGRTVVEWLDDSKRQARHEEAVADLKSQLRDMQKDRDRLRADVETARHNQRQAEQLADDLQETVAELRKDRDELYRSVKLAEREAAGARNEIERLRNECDEYRQAYELADEDARKKEREAMDAREEIRRLKEENTRLRARPRARRRIGHHPDNAVAGPDPRGIAVGCMLEAITSVLKAGGEEAAAVAADIAGHARKMLTKEDQTPA